MPLSYPLEENLRDIFKITGQSAAHLIPAVISWIWHESDGIFDLFVLFILWIQAGLNPRPHIKVQMRTSVKFLSI